MAKPNRSPIVAMVVMVSAHQHHLATKFWSIARTPSDSHVKNGVGLWLQVVRFWTQSLYQSLGASVGSLDATFFWSSPHCLPQITLRPPRLASTHPGYNCRQRVAPPVLGHSVDAKLGLSSPDHSLPSFRVTVTPGVKPQFQPREGACHWRAGTGNGCHTGGSIESHAK